MALTRRDIIQSSFAALVAWAVIGSLIPSLRFLPYAFVAGCLACTLGIFYLLTTTARPAGYIHRATFPPTSYLSFTNPRTWKAESKALVQRSIYHPPRLYDTSSPLTKAADRLLEDLGRAFVKSWYGKISDAPGFPNEVDRTIRVAVRNVSQKLATVDLVDLAVTRILPVFKNHLNSYAEAEAAVHGKNFGRNVTETEELDAAIAAKYRDGRVHPAASLTKFKSAAPLQRYLRRLVTRAMPKVLPAEMMGSPSVNIMIRELVACAVLSPVVKLLSDPDFLYRQIESYGNRVLQERHSVNQLRAALDEQIDSPKKETIISRVPKLTPQDSERAFERFVRAIRSTTSLPEAKRLRSEVIRQIKREGEFHAADSTYMRRLEVGRKLLEQRVAQLSDTAAGRTVSAQSVINGSHSQREDASLREVLYDASGLSYYMEYMDRLNLLAFVQFWIVVDGLRNPLDYSGDSWTESERQDLIALSNSYLWKPELNVSKASQATVKAFVQAGKKATLDQYKAARGAVDEVQRNVFAEMNEKHLPNFKKSDLFYKWVTSEAARASVPRGRERDHPSHDLDVAKGPVATLSANHVMPQTTSDGPLKSPALTRTLASFTDVTTASRVSSPGPASRRSMDDHSSQRPLFDDDLESDPLVNSVASLPSDLGHNANGRVEDDKMVEAAVQDALNDIVVQKPSTSSLFGSEDPLTSSQTLASPRPDSPNLFSKDRPSLASLGLLGTPHKRTVFSEGDLFGEQEKMWEDDNEDARSQASNDSNPRSAQPENGSRSASYLQADDDGIKEAAPGDLGLTEIIQSLSLDIDKLEAQQKIVDSLTGKAELTNNAAELRILRKSRASLDREIQRKQLQKQQYIIQESENTLYGRAAISITNVMVGNDADGHEFAVYVIRVARTSPSSPASADNSIEKSEAAWAISRRYSEFHALHKALCRRFPFVRDIDFPRRQTLLTLQKDFLRKRRIALERFLRELLTHASVCRSLELRAFLSQQAIRPLASSDAPAVDRQDLITRIYNSVTDGMEDFLGNVPVLDQLSLAGQSIISAATSVASTPSTPSFPPNTPSAFITDPNTAAEAQREIAATGDKTTFIKPIVDAFLALFALHKATGNAWLRGRTIVIVLQQLLGGTVERRVREAWRTNFASPSAIAGYIDLVHAALFPREPALAEVRTAKARAQTKRAAQRALAALLEDAMGGIVGRREAAAAGMRAGRALGSERLNVGLVAEIMDVLIEAVIEGN